MSKHDHKLNPDFCRDDVHGMFGLTYASYLVLPRSVLQSMPPEWQHEFSALVDQLTHQYSGYEMDYTVYKRDGRGRFAKDPLGDYARGRRFVPPKSFWDEAQLSSSKGGDV